MVQEVKAEPPVSDDLWGESHVLKHVFAPEEGIIQLGLRRGSDAFMDRILHTYEQQGYSCSVAAMVLACHQSDLIKKLNQEIYDLRAREVPRYDRRS